MYSVCYKNNFNIEVNTKTQKAEKAMLWQNRLAKRGVLEPFARANGTIRLLDPSTMFRMTKSTQHDRLFYTLNKVECGEWRVEIRMRFFGRLRMTLQEFLYCRLCKNKKQTFVCFFELIILCFSIQFAFAVAC